MQTRTLILLLGLIACALAARGGGGGGGRGGHGGGIGRGGQFGGADKFPQTCKTDNDNQKQCFADNIKAKGVAVDLDQVKACFDSCQRPARPEGGAQGNRTKGNWGGRQGKGGWGGRHGNGTGANGNFTQMQEQRKAYGECIKNKMGDKQEQCVKGKITYAVVARDQQGGKGGRGGFGFGNPLKSLASKAEKCGEQTQNCVKSALGEWYDKVDELSQILCDASTACPHTTSDACKADRKAGKLAACQCREQLRPDLEQAQKDCTTAENTDAVNRQGKGKGKGEHQQRSCDEQNNNDDDKPEHQRPSPFCPRPEGSKQRFAKHG